MVWQNWVSLTLYFILLIGLSIPLSGYMALILQGEVPKSLNLLQKFELLIYRFCKINTSSEQRARHYLKDLLIMNALGLFFVFFVLVFQGFLPFNPQNFPGLSWHLALNTAVSFMSNTNWQAYSGEASLSHFSQMVALTTQNFLSAATGLAVMAALARGLSRKVEDKVGSFLVDVVKITLYILLPLSFILALILLSQGVIQNFGEYITATTIEGATQIIPTGPAASQIAIKQLGTNGGGFFGVNSAHPFENPNPISNFFQAIALLLIPVAQVLCFGRMVLNKKHGYALLTTMFVIFLPLLLLSLYSEFQGVPNLGINMEGKDVRFGVMDSTLWSVATTAASNGSVNAMHGSLTPISGLVCLFQILTGEVIFGGAGSGLYGMVLYVLITVFLAGLMVGRSPEYLGKKIEAYEVKMAMFAILIPSALVLIGSSLGAISSWGTTAMSHKGPHGFSEILYGFASTTGNNGSAFGGLAAGSSVLNTFFAFCMLIGRFVVIIPIMEIAGSLARKRTTPPSSGTFPTDNLLFVILLSGVVIIFGALTFFPVLVLGPIAEHFLMMALQTF